MRYINPFRIFPVHPAGFNPASPSFPLTGNRPVNILTSQGRPTPKQAEPVRETVKE